MTQGKNDIRIIRRAFPASALRLTNIIDNVLDLLVWVLLFVGLTLVSFSLIFAFVPLPLFNATKLLGIETFAFLSDEMVADAQRASLSTLTRGLGLVFSLVAFVTIRRRLMIALTLPGLVFLWLAASPLPLQILRDVFELPFCVFPLSMIMQSGAAIMGHASSNASICQPVFPSDHVLQPFFSSFQVLYAAALLPLTLAAIASTLLVRTPKLRNPKAQNPVIWMVAFLKSLGPAAKARLSRDEMWAVCSLFISWALIFVALSVPFLPLVSRFEINLISGFALSIDPSGVLGDTSVGIYAGPGRQMIFIAFIFLAYLLFRKRWGSAILLAAVFLTFPVFIYLGIMKMFLTFQANFSPVVFLLFLVIVGLASYIATFPDLARLVRQPLAVLALASRRASKLSRRSEPPILYLRPFAQDVMEAQTLPSMALRVATVQPRRKPIEAFVAEAAFRFAPLVALGDPRTTVEPVGAVREYTTNDQWQVRIEEMLRRTKAVLFLIGATSSVKWEVDTILDKQLLNRTLFIFPPDQAIIDQFFLENRDLANALDLPDGFAKDAVSQKWAAFWKPDDEPTTVFVSGPSDELTYKLAVAHRLRELM